MRSSRSSKRRRGSARCSALVSALSGKEVIEMLRKLMAAVLVLEVVVLVGAPMLNGLVIDIFWWLKR